MSTEMNTTQDVVSMTRFYGGSENGLSLQLTTIKTPIVTNHRYIAVRMVDVPGVIADLQAAYDQSIKDGVFSP